MDQSVGAQSNLSGTVASRMVSDGPVHWRAPLEYLVMQPVYLRGVFTRRFYISRPIGSGLRGPLLVPPKKGIYSCFHKKSEELLIYSSVFFGQQQELIETLWYFIDLNREKF
jgi:hypothetical protein